MQVLTAEPLVEPLARRQVDGNQQAWYLLGSFLVFMVPGYLGVMPSTATTTGFSWAIALEGWLNVGIAVFGVLAARDAAGGAENKDFITEFTCLYLPVAFTTLALVWSIYWLVALLLQDSLTKWSEEDLQFLANLRLAGMDLFSLFTLMAHVASNAIIYVRITRLLRRVQAAK